MRNLSWVFALALIVLSAGMAFAVTADISKEADAAIDAYRNGQLTLEQKAILDAENINPEEFVGTDNVGTPDAFGYTWLDSEEAGLDYGWIDISTTGTAVEGLADDNSVGPFDIGFDFPFYGMTKTQFWMNSNGQINFDAGYSGLGNVAYPSTSGGASVAWFWDDLNVFNDADAEIYYETTTVDGQDALVCTYINYNEYSGPGQITAQIVLFADGQILLQYASLADGIDITSCTLGINAGDGVGGVHALYNASIAGYPYDELAILFYTLEADATVDGTVTDDGGAALEGVTVSLGALTATTDANGYYLFEDVFSGTYPLSGSMAGYVDYSEEVVVSAGTNTFDFTMEALPVLTWGEAAYNWIDIVTPGTATQVAMGDDSGTTVLFADYGLGTFNYYGVDFSSIRVNANGWASFTSTSSSWTPYEIPNTNEPNNLLALLWDDLHGTLNDAQILVDVIDNQFVITYQNVSFRNTNWFTGQIVLDFNTGLIYYNYQEFSIDAAYTSPHAIGFENATGDMGESIFWGDTFESHIAETSYFIGMPGTIEGTVTANVGGAAIEGAEVTVYVADGVDPIASTFTDADGMYAVTVGAGTYDVSVVAAGYLATMEEDVVVDADATVTLDFGLDAQETFVTVTGVINSLDTPAELIEGITVGLYTPAGVLVGSDVTDATGAYSIGDNDIALGTYDFRIGFVPVGLNFYHDATYEDITVDEGLTYDFGVFEILPPAEVVAEIGNAAATISWDLPANAVEVTASIIANIEANIAASIENNNAEKLDYYTQQLEYYQALYTQQQNGTDDLTDLEGFIIVNEIGEVQATTNATTFSYTFTDLTNGEEYTYSVAADYGYGDAYLVFSAEVNVTPIELVYTFTPATFDWVDVRGDANTTVLGLSDDGEAWIDFPEGSTFSLFGIPFDGMTVGANGGISFLPNVQVGYTPAALPTASAPDYFVGPLWEDLNPSAGDDYDVWYTYDADGVLWIEWYTQYFTSANGIVDLEVGFNFEDNTMIWQYNEADMWDPDAIVGVQETGTTYGYMFPTDQVADGLALNVVYEQLFYGDIEGYVVDTNDDGIEGVDVYNLGEVIATTDNTGYYTASVIATEQTFDYMHAMYSPATLTATVNPEVMNTLDDVVMTSWGAIEGYVVDVDDNGIEDVEVLLGGVLLTTTDATGWYHADLEIPSGDYTFDFEHDMYWPESVTAAVTLGSTTTMDDVVMTAPGEFDIDPTSLEMIVYITEEDPVYTGSEILDLANGGSGPIEYSASIEILSVPENWGVGVANNPNPNRNTVERAFSRSEAVEASPLGPVEATWNETDDVWDFIDGWDTEETTGGVGAVVTDDRVYTCEWGYSGLYGFYEYDLEGNLIRTETFPTALQGVRDMAWDGEWLYGGNANANGTIYKFDPDDLNDYELLGTATGCGRGVALDFSTGDIYSTNWSALGKLENVGGVYNFVAMTYPTAAASCYGVAWMPADPDGMNLWLYCQPSSNGVVFRYDPDSGDLDAGYEVYSSDLGMAGGIDIYNGYDPYMWNIATNVQADPDHIDIWEGYEAGVPWLFVEPAEDTVEAGETNQITVSFNVEGHDLLEWVEHMDEVEAAVVFEGAHWEGGEVPMLITFIDAAGETSSELPMEYALHQNYPNPFNPATTIKFDLVDAQNVKISIFNVLGQQVAQLVNGRMEAGFHSVSFDASQLSSGVYFYRMETGAYTNMKKMVLVK